VPYTFENKARAVKGAYLFCTSDALLIPKRETDRSKKRHTQTHTPSRRVPPEAPGAHEGGRERASERARERERERDRERERERAARMQIQFQKKKERERERERETHLLSESHRKPLARRLSLISYPLLTATSSSCTCAAGKKFSKVTVLLNVL